MSSPRRLLASFTGSGVFGATPLLRVLEALEKRKVLFHKAIPGRTEVALARLLEDTEDPMPGGFTTRRIQLEWREFRVEPQLSQDGLGGLREALPDLPTGLRGIRVQVGYTFPKRDPEALLLTARVLDGGRWEVRLGADGERVLDATNKKLSRANALLLADLAEAMYDVLEPAYGAVRLDAGVLPDQLPTGGWGFYSGQLVERAGRGAVEAYAAGCHKSWELADGGWFLAPRPLDEPDGELAQARDALFAPCRHLALEAMREPAWKAN
jgi:hypothetical protein